MVPTAGLVANTLPVAQPDADFSYDPTSPYDQKGVGQPRGFSAQAPSELVDPYSGNLILHHTDLFLPGDAGLDLTIQRVYNSKIHRNYAALASADPQRVNSGLQFVPPSPLGLGWTMHMGRLVGAVSPLPNNLLPGPRYYEASDGSQHPFFTNSGPTCGDGRNDVCLTSKGHDNLYKSAADDLWHLATANGLHITFGHAAADPAYTSLTLIYYATEIRDIHGNTIEIHYLGENDTVYGYTRHFIDYIDLSDNRRVEFNYSVVNQPNLVRLTSIEAAGRTYIYKYSLSNPWTQEQQAFLTSTEPPEGSPWLYEYAGLTNGDCDQNSQQRRCELTKVTYPTGGTIEYTFEDLDFWTHGNPARVRAVVERVVGGREVEEATWSYSYDRANNASEDHTVITRPDGSQEVYTYFGVGSGDYDPWDSAWQAGALREKRIRIGASTVLQKETYEWEPSPPISDEVWGDPWIGFDPGVRVPRLREHKITRDNLTWTTEHSSYNDLNDTPRCTTETSSDGTARYRLTTYQELSGQGVLAIQFRNLPAVEGLSYSAFSNAVCRTQDDAVSISAAARLTDEVYEREYTTEGQVKTRSINGIRTDYQYDSNGNLDAEITRQDGANSYCTVYSEYQYGVAKKIGYGASAPACSTNAALYEVVRDVNDDGTIARETNFGNTTSFEYDDLGRLESIDPPGEATIEIHYDTDGGSDAIRRVDQGSYQHESRFDGFGRKILESTSAGVSIRQSFDKLGRLQFRSLPSTTGGSDGDSFTYDALGRLMQVEHSDQSAVDYDYEESQHIVKITDELGRETRQGRRAFANPDDYWITSVQVPDEDSSTATYAYLVGGHLTAVNYAGRERTLEYTAAKLVSHEYNPESGHVYYGYDDAGNLRCRHRGSANRCGGNGTAEVRYTVDGLGRVTETRYSSGPARVVTFEYDDANNLIAMRDSAGRHRFTYTRTNRLHERISIIGSQTFTTTYGYDLRGNLGRIEYPSGRLISYTLDDGNRIKSVRDQSDRYYVTNIDYHPNGMAERLTYGNGVVTTLGLDDRQRPDTLSAPGVLGLNYEYDDVGNVTSLSDSINPINNTTFVYDDLDRLKNADGLWGSLGYEYEPNGDRKSETLNGQSAVYTYNIQGHLENLTGRVALSLTYDSSGNVKSRGNPNARDFSYYYDLENRLLRVLKTEVPGSPTTVVDYGYDGQGKRMLVTRPLGCQDDLVYHYDQEGNRIAESTQDGLFLKEYIVANGQTVAELDVRPVRSSPSSIEFGSVEVGATITRTVSLSNRTNQPLSLSNTSLAWPFRLGIQLPFVIPANATVDLPVSFAPIQRGSFEGKLQSCQSNGVMLDVALSGRGVAAQAVFDPPLFNLGDVPMGAVVTRTLVMRNAGDAPLRVAGWQYSDAALSVAPAAPTVIQPGDAYTLTLTFDSIKACGGPYSGQLRLDSNSQPPGVVPVRANVLALEIDERELNFGPLAVGASRTLTATLRNRAVVPLTATLDLSGAPQFQVGALPAGSLAPGASITVPVSYQPTTEQWSPFGDHATLSVSAAGCYPSCDASSHLIGNIAAESMLEYGALDRPALAIITDTVHVASAATISTTATMTTTIAHFTRSGAAAWEREPDPTSGAMDAGRPALIAGPDGRLTMLWHEKSNSNQLKLRQRVGEGDWGDICMQPGQRVGAQPLAADSVGNTWLIWWDWLSQGMRSGAVFSGAGVCQAGQASYLVAREHWFGLSVAAHPGSQLNIAADTYALRTATLDLTSGAAQVENPIMAFVATPTNPALAIDANGGWHLAWSERTTGSRATIRYMYRAPGGSWSQPVSFANGASQAGEPTLALDAGGGVHIAWTDQLCPDDVRPKLYYATKRASSSEWEVTDVSTPGYSTYRFPTLLSHGSRVLAGWHGVSASGDAVLLIGEAGASAQQVLQPVP